MFRGELPISGVVKLVLVSVGVIASVMRESEEEEARKVKQVLADLKSLQLDLILASVCLDNISTQKQKEQADALEAEKKSTKNRK